MIVSKKKYQGLIDMFCDNQELSQNTYAKLCDIQSKLNKLLEVTQEVVPEVIEPELSPFLTKDGLYSYKQYEVGQQAKQTEQFRTLNKK